MQLQKRLEPRATLLCTGTKGLSLNYPPRLYIGAVTGTECRRETEGWVLTRRCGTAACGQPAFCWKLARGKSEQGSRTSSALEPFVSTKPLFGCNPEVNPDIGSYYCNSGFITVSVPYYIGRHILSIIPARPF
jgi:hypothetical protein